MLIRSRLILDRVFARQAFWISALLAALLLIPNAAARPVQAPASDGFNLYTHRHWTLEDGAPPDIWAITQAPDGFLWLGTGAGLYRFDGVRFEHFRPLPGETLNGADIVSLLETRSGDLWIGYMNGGVTRLHEGHLRNFDIGTPPGAISDFVEAGDGTIWAAVQSGTGTGGLGRFDGKLWHPLNGAEGVPAGSTPDIALDRAGNIWVATLDAVFMKPAGQRRFVPTGETLGGSPSHLFADPVQGMWSADKYRGARFMLPPGARPKGGSAKGAAVAAIATDNLFFDRAGTLWGDLRSGGLFQIADPQPYRNGHVIPLSAIGSTFTTTNGLSASHVRPFFQDREGTIWVGTNGGLDRFRPASITRESALAWKFDAPSLGDLGQDGIVYTGLEHALYAVKGTARPRLVADHLPLINKVCVGGDHLIWTISNDNALTVVRDGHPTPVDPVPGDHPQIITCARDPEGLMWISADGIGLLRQRSASSLSFDRMFTREAADMIFFAPSGALWIVDRTYRLTAIHGQSARVYSAKDGLNVGPIQILQTISHDLLVGGDLGLARFDGRRFQTLRAEDYPAFSRVTGITEQGDSTWLFGITALARIKTKSLVDAFARPGSFLGARTFDSRDGLPGSALQDWGSNTLIGDRTGRLWLFTNNGVASIDPNALVKNMVVPPVTIRRLVAGGRDYDAPRFVELPKGVTSVQIDYAAPSLAMPERVRVLYRLDGVDRDWTDPGSRRQAFYTNLEPGTYRFQLIAANDSGVWNDHDGSLTFVISPTFTQTLTFKLLCGIAILLLVSAVYVIWVAQVGRDIQMRLEERLGERERIARELHDTLLQGIQGLMLRFQAVANRLPKDNDERHMIDRALDSAESMIVKGRTSLMGLRTHAPPTSLRQGFDDFARRQALSSDATIDIAERGTPRPLMPTVHHEAARIGEEAIFNAVRHGRPSRIEIEIVHEPNSFAMTIRDDGIGFAPAILRSGGRDGHFGMAGMRERARRIRGKLRIANRADGGAEVALRVPARIAYGRPRRRSIALLRRRRGTIFTGDAEN